MENPRIQKTYLKIKKGKQAASGFTIIPNGLSQTNQLTFRAKGLLLYFLSLPDDFVIHVEYLLKTFKEGKHIIYQTIEELKKEGYVRHQRIRDDKGRVTAGYYFVYDEPQLELITEHQSSLPSKNQEEALMCSESVPDPDFQDIDNQDEEKLHLDNPPLINKYNKKEIIKKETAANETKEELLEETQIAAGCEDIFIAKTLSAHQEKTIKQEAMKLISYVPYDLSRLVREIAFELLDPGAFVKCEGLFYKKLNAIVKIIKQGKWTPPAKLYQVKKEEKEAKFIELKKTFQVTQQDYQHCQKMLAFHGKRQEKPLVDYYQEQCAKLNQALAHLKQTLVTYQRGVNG